MMVLVYFNALFHCLLELEFRLFNLICIYLCCSLDCEEDLPEAGLWCGWLPEDLQWSPEEWIMSAAPLQEQWCHFSQHPAAAAEDGHHWCWSQGVISLLSFTCLYLIASLSLLPFVSAVLYWYCIAVEGSSPPREGVILTRLLEGLLLMHERFQLNPPDIVMFGSRTYQQFWIRISAFLGWKNLM
jgi:hypothetical protein